MKKRPTIKDVARLSGLSVSTVSLVINNRGYVSADAKRKVLKVVEELAYHPTRSARGLASKTSGNIGFILSEDHFTQAEPFYTRIFLGTEFGARAHNYYILLTAVGERFGKPGDMPRFLLERNVDGVIIAGKINVRLAQAIAETGIPIVLVDFAVKRMRASSVLIDNRGGARAATQHLVQCGHRQIAFVGGDIEHPSIGERFLGYREVLEENEIPRDERLISIDEPDPRVPNGEQAIASVFARGGKPTAVFAANDAMAIGCMRFAKRSGIHIPDDLAIIGFDDIDITAHLEPHLSTVKVFKEEMGKLAVQRLVEILNSKSQALVTTHVPVELVVRESTIGKMQEQSVPVVAAEDSLL